MSFKKKIRYIYERTPFRQAILTVVRKFWHPGQNLINLLYFDGIFDLKIDKARSFKMRNYGYGFVLENELFWKGLYLGHERFSMKVWTKLSEEARVVLDIGANTGIYSLITKSVNPQAMVYAFEPIHRVFDKLMANINLNEMEINCCEKAVSDSDGRALIYDAIGPHEYSATLNPDGHPVDFKGVHAEVELVRLDSFIEAEGLEQIDLVKIDVESHEPEVLLGFGKYLERFKPVMLIEILTDEIGARIEEIVQDKDYLYFNIDDAADRFVRTDNIKKSHFYNYLLCDRVTASSLGLID